MATELYIGGSNFVFANAVNELKSNKLTKMKLNYLASRTNRGELTGLGLGNTDDLHCMYVVPHSQNGTPTRGMIDELM